MRWMNPDDYPLFFTPESAESTQKRPVFASRNDPAVAISVSELNRRVKGLLEANFELRWVRGELSNVIRAASGHWYFSLKDESAQVRCVMFKQRAQGVSFTPVNGLEVEVRALPSLYEARGEFQLGVETMRLAGLGAMYEAFEQLKKKLAAEGLFDEHRKRPLPIFAHTLGIVTSSKGAALHDVLTTLQRRAPMINIIIYPTAVQGLDAPREIAAAITTVAKRNEIDALLICRGGGSIEDLWAFNHEAVARAIIHLQNQTNIIVVSAVGHETDFTICDFVADRRAPTPTAGAELLSPDTPQLRISIQRQQQTLRQHALQIVRRHQQAVDFAARGLVSPQERLQREHENLKLIQLRLTGAIRAQLQQRRLGALEISHQLRQLTPDVRQYSHVHIAIGQALRRAMVGTLDQHHQLIKRHRHALELLSPLRVLTRGYAIVNIDGKGVVNSINNVRGDDQITVRFHDGELAARVEKTTPAAST